MISNDDERASYLHSQWMMLLTIQWRIPQIVCIFHMNVRLPVALIRSPRLIGFTYICRRILIKLIFDFCSHRYHVSLCNNALCEYVYGINFRGKQVNSIKHWAASPCMKLCSVRMTERSSPLLRWKWTCMEFQKHLLCLVECWCHVSAPTTSVMRVYVNIKERNKNFICKEFLTVIWILNFFYLKIFEF